VLETGLTSVAVTIELLNAVTLKVLMLLKLVTGENVDGGADQVGAAGAVVVLVVLVVFAD
jgi:hypothetical protein